jgi:hypothetical protein
MLLRMLLAAALTISAAIAQAQAQAQAQTVEVGGARFPTTVQVGNAQVPLNGAGIRHKFVVKVYAAGLYVNARAATPEQVFAAAGPRRMHVVMLRDIDGNELGKLFTDGMQKNATREEFAKVIPGTIKLGEIFATRKKLLKDESFSVDYVPGTGTRILVNGTPTGDVIKEPEFFTALMKIWLGKNPADHLLKDALLGKQAADA